MIGSRIRQARLKCSPSVSQEDLAGRLAAQNIVIDRTAISRIENQTPYIMDYEIAAIARSLKVSVGWLFGEAENRRKGSRPQSNRQAPGHFAGGASDAD
jgi:HTH-type transcriptional regulator, cell division transcriptional repressor